MLALRPVEPLERGLDWLLLPVRGMEALAAPLAWLQGRRVHAADESTLALRREEALEQAELEDALRFMARPEELALPAGVVGLRAEVVQRPGGHLDRLLVRVEDPSVIEQDLPVISGDSYVGRVDLDATRRDARLAPDLYYVELVTGAEFRVGAVTDDGACRMVVGGLAPLGDVRLGVHNPEDPSRSEGRVVVSEPPLVEGRGDLANGFHLGRLLAEQPDPSAPRRRLVGLVPELDYATGLHQLLVLLPPDAPRPKRRLRIPLEHDGHWAPVHFAVRGEISPPREGRPLARGRLQGVRDGAALADGTRLVGRVLHAGLFESSVALLGDPGLPIPALALLRTPEGLRIHVLGRLWCLGRDGNTVRLLWPAVLPLETPLETTAQGEDSIPARIWTGSGEALMPRGLLLGDARLPVGPGPHVLTLTLPPGAEDPAGVRVRLGQEGQP